MKIKFDVKSKKLAPVLAILVIFVVSAFIFQRTDAQKKDVAATGGKNPKVNIKVNKQTDKNGNVTRYDSTYVWSWSGNENVPENMDSLISSMHKRFFKNDFFDKDSLFSKQFQSGFQNLNDSSFFSGNFGQFFNDDFGSLDKMMQNFFKQEPLLKVPDDAVKPAPKQPKKKVEKQNNLVRPNNYSGGEEKLKWL